MFLNTNKFKKMLKTAYKGTGFTIGSIDECGVFIQTSTWSVWFERITMPNRIKAAIVEFSGTIPENGEIFKVREGEPNQMEMDITAKPRYDIKAMWMNAKRPLKKLPILFDFRYIVAQTYQDAKRNIVIVNHAIEDILKKSEMDEMEDSVMGPCTYQIDNGKVFYATDRCVFAMEPICISEGDLYEAKQALETVNFSEEV